MKIRLLFICVLFTFVAWSSTTKPAAASSPTPGTDPARLTEIMNRQAAAWNNGDLDAYMVGYWNSDSLVFSGGKSITYGYDATLTRYKKSYSDKAAMGRLEFDQLEHHFLAAEQAFTTGQWTLFRTADTLSGRFTLVWKRFDFGWKIVADHSS